MAAAANAGFGGDPMLAAQQAAAFRSAAAAGPAAYAAPATANLFSSVAVPGSTLGGGGEDSGNSSGDMVEGGRGARGSRTAEQRAAAVQEKNRRAQKRFRERQKARMTDMTSQLEDMSGELSKLRMENNSLKNRNSILEKVLALRDEHIRVLQDEQQVFDLGSSYAHAAASGPKLIAGGAGGGAGGALMLGMGPGALTTTEIKAVKSMPSEVVIGRWKDTVRELGNILVQVRVHVGGGGDGAGRQQQPDRLVTHARPLPLS